MRKGLTLWLITAALACGMQVAAAAEGIRCGNKLISRGDHETELLRYCGKPDSVHSRVTTRGVIGAGSVFLPGFVEEVLVEQWTYNLGPRKLMRSITLENGVVRDVEHLGYGYIER